MKLYIITNQTRTSVTQAVCTLEELTAADHAEAFRDLQAMLAFQAAVNLERHNRVMRFVPKRIDSSRQPASKLRSSNRKELRRLRESQKSVLLAFPVGGAQ